MIDGIPADCAAKFRPLKLLGEGGYGRVFLAEQTDLGRQVALKVLRAEASADSEQLARFVEEGRVAAQLSHPNVVRVIDAGAATGVPWLVYELVEGPTLREKTAGRPMRWTEAVEAASQVASALEEAHRRAIVHRDVKAENVLQSADGTYKLADFGIAKWADTGVKTRTGFVIGTPTHLAPELIRGSPASPASDVYALGVLLYELLTGRLPFRDENLGHLMEQHLEEPVVTPARLQPGLPDRLSDVVKEALEKSPEARVPSARALRERLEAILRTHRQRPPAAAAPTVVLSGRSWAGPAVGAALVLVTMGFALRRTPAAVDPPRSPASIAASASPSVADDELEQRLLAAAGALERLQRVSNEVSHRMHAIVPPPTGKAWADAMGAELNESLRQTLHLITYMDAHGVRGPGWHFVTILADDALRTILAERGALTAHAAPLLDQLLQLREPAGADDFRRDLTPVLSAAVSMARGERSASELQFVRAYTAALATARRQPPPARRDRAVALRALSLVTWARATHAKRAQEQGVLSLTDYADAVRDQLAVGPAVLAALEDPFTTPAQEGENSSRCVDAGEKACRPPLRDVLPGAERAAAIQLIERIVARTAPKYRDGLDERVALLQTP